MVEVLIAGILLASALAAVSRISVAALSSSANLSERARLEAAINDNIQSMQKEDSYLTTDWISNNQIAAINYIRDSQSKPHYDSVTEECKNENTQSEKCISAFDFYFQGKGDDKEKDATDCISSTNQKTSLDCACTAPDLILRMHLESIVDKPREAEISRNFNYTDNFNTLIIDYAFEGPEQQVGKEKRIVEMTPNFAAHCYSTR